MFVVLCKTLHILLEIWMSTYTSKSEIKLRKTQEDPRISLLIDLEPLYEKKVEAKTDL